MPLVTHPRALCAGPFADYARLFVELLVAFEILRFGIVLPTHDHRVITYTSLYQRFYGIAAQIVAPLHATCSLQWIDDAPQATR